AGLLGVAAARNPQILLGLDMRGWLAAPLTARDGAYGSNLGLIQLSDKYDGEFTEQDEAELAQLAQVGSIAVDNRLCRRREQRLREAAENAAHAKDEFMAMTSYRLRAQLNTLLGWSWVLRRQAENLEDVTRAAEIIERAARTQAQLVEDLLGASRKGSIKWRDEEKEGQGDWGTGRLGDKGIWELGEWEVGEWNDEANSSLSPCRPVAQSPGLLVPPSSRASVHYPPNSASRGLAAGGGC